MHVRFLQVLGYERTKTQTLTDETLKIYRALPAFYKATIVPMFRWSFRLPGFRLNSDNLLAPLTINRSGVLARISVLEVSLEQLVFQEPAETPASTGGQFDGERECQL
jgi:hypothetical protein